MYAYDLTFDQYQMLIKNIYCMLKVLHLSTTSEDINYRNATRWERFILEDLPQLKELNFDYYEYIDDEEQFSSYLGESNQFTSSFWIERQWIFEATINSDDII